MQICRNFVYNCNMEPTQLLINILKDNGHSVTNARETVFELLLDSEPQTIAQLAKASGNRVNRASLYRIIELFEQLHIVQRVYVGWKYKLELTDAFQQHHHHITCKNCEKVIPITEDEAVEALIAQLARAHGVQPTGHVLEIQGICADCQASRRV